MQQVLDTRSAAQCVGVSRQTLAKWRVAGSGPRYFKAGAKVLYVEAALKEWMEQRTCSSTAQRVIV